MSEFIVELIDYIPQAESAMMPELSPTLKTTETNARLWQAHKGLEKFSYTKAEVQEKEYKDFEKLLEEGEERSETEKRQRARLKAEKEKRSAKLKEQEAELRAQRAMQKAEAEKKAYEDDGLEELFNEDKTIGAEEIKEDRERSEAEEKEEIWKEYLAKCSESTVNYYAENPIKAQESADRWYKFKQGMREEARKSEWESEKTRRMMESSRRLTENLRKNNRIRAIRKEGERQAEIRRNEESMAARNQKARERAIKTIKLMN